ncbi:hypothetical protein [Phyllobacterium salinisoli]|nr:hypothetical protein [Phyllobacterium salinisoli]
MSVSASSTKQFGAFRMPFPASRAFKQSLHLLARDMRSLSAILKTLS